MKWTADEQGVYWSDVAPNFPFPTCFSFLSVETHPQPVASRHIIELTMPGMSLSCAAGTECYDLLFSIYLIASNKDTTSCDANTAVRLLDEAGL